MKELTLHVPEGKAAVAIRAQSLKDIITSGNIEPVRAIVWLKGLEKIIETVSKDAEVKEIFMDSLSAYNEKVIEEYSAKITKKLSAAKYDFSACQDVEWERLTAQMATLKERIKDREDMLKTLRKPEERIDPESGEVYTIFPPPKTQGETYAVQLV